MSRLSNQIPHLMMMLLISFFTGFTVSLNKYANDKSKRKIKSKAYYLSEAFLSVICGISVGLLGKHVFEESPELWIVCSASGAYAYRKTLNLISKIILSKISMTVVNKDVTEKDDDCEDYKKEDNSDDDG